VSRRQTNPPQRKVIDYITIQLREQPVEGRRRYRPLLLGVRSRRALGGSNPREAGASDFSELNPVFRREFQNHGQPWWSRGRAGL